MSWCRAALAGVYFAALVGLAAFGARSVVRAGGEAVALLPVLLVLLHGFVFFGDPRFHAPMTPMLAVAAGVMLHGACISLCSTARGEPAPMKSATDQSER